MLKVPSDAPVVDPLAGQGNWFKAPVAVRDSGLSATAKLAYYVLRSHIYFGLGFTFVTRERLEQDMSRERKAIDRALDDLIACGLIRKVEGKWQGKKKNYIYFEPMEKWKLPPVKERRKLKDEDEIDDAEAWATLEEMSKMADDHFGH
jgi:hypothetical protein